MIRCVSWIRRRVAPIAIDFGHRVVRMAQMARQANQFTLLACAQRELPVSETDDARRRALQEEAVRDMLARDTFVGRSAITALDWEDLTIRPIRLRQVPQSQWPDAVCQEAAQHLGLDLTTTELRFLVAGDVRHGTGLGQEVIVLAAARSAIDDHVARLIGMGLDPAAIDAPCCALFRPFQRLLRRGEDRAVVNVFVDIGYAATRVLVVRGNRLMFVRSIPIGGRRFDELVSQQMDLTLPDAALLRIRAHRHHAALAAGQARLPEPEGVSETMRRALLDPIRPALEHLGGEIAGCIRYCSSTFRGLQAEAVTVVGGEAFDRDMLQLLSDQVNLPLRSGRPLRHIAIEPALASSERRTGQPDWAAVLGLALKPVGAPMVTS